MQSEKQRILQRINRKLYDRSQHGPHSNYLDKAVYFTGLHPSTLKNLERSEPMNLDDEGIDRDLIYNTLCNFYVRYRSEKKLPTTKELFEALNKTDKLVHTDIGAFRKLLLKLGFIWRKVGDHNSQLGAVVIENPHVRLEKFNYLMQIRRSRNENSNDIYFIDEVAYNEDMFVDAEESREIENFGNDVWLQRVIYAVGVKTVVGLKAVEEFNEAVVEDWITKDLCKILSRPSTIVAPDKGYFKAKLLEIPTLYSTKLEIGNWLDYHNIPYDPVMSKYELYSLADEYTDLETPLYKIDGILKARGHSFLRLPASVEKLSPAAILFQTIKANWKRTEGQTYRQDPKALAKSCFENLIINAAKNLKNFTTAVISDEKQCVHVENNVDSTLDQMVIDSNSTAFSLDRIDSDVASCSDTDSE